MSAIYEESEIMSEVASEDTIRFARERLLDVPYGTETFLDFGDADNDFVNETEDDISTVRGDNLEDSVSEDTEMTDQTKSTVVLPARLAVPPVSISPPPTSQTQLQPAPFYENTQPRSLALRPANPARAADPNRANMRQMEISLSKEELAEIRPWDTNRACFKNKVDNYMGRDTRARLWIHEACQLEAIRKEKGAEIRMRNFETSEGKEWLLEVIAVAATYLRKCKNGFEKLEDGAQKTHLLEAVSISEMWLNTVQEEYNAL
jgi:hypothetical protein